MSKKTVPEGEETLEIIPQIGYNYNMNCPTDH